jgi:predicted transcriptional regulator
LGWQGIKRENDTKNAILEFLIEKNEAGFSEIADYCSKKGISRMTVKTYLDKLKDDNLVTQSVKGRHPYSIPQEKLQTVKLMLKRNDFFKNIEQKAESINNPKAFEFLNAQVLEYESRIKMAVYEVWLNGLTPAILEFINAVNNVFFGNIEKEEDISALKKWGEILIQSYAKNLAYFKKIYDDLKFHPILEMPIDGNQRIMFDIDAQGLDHYIFISDLLKSELDGLNFFIKLKLEGQDAVKFFKKHFHKTKIKKKEYLFCN